MAISREAGLVVGSAAETSVRRRPAISADCRRTVCGRVGIKLVAGQLGQVIAVEHQRRPAGVVRGQITAAGDVYTDEPDLYIEPGSPRIWDGFTDDTAS